MARDTLAGRIFVDLAVAVVVFPIAANFGDRLILGETRQLAVDASLRACFALAQFARDIAVSAFFGKVIIDGPIAVIIQAVADLVGGLFVGDTSKCPSDAAQRTVSTDPLPCGQASDPGDDPVIHLAVAIVVFVVAHLRRSKHTACTGRPLGILADLRAIFALTFSAIGRRPPETRLRQRARSGGLVVDLPVTIVIQAIADLDPGGDFALAGLPTTELTFLCARFADTEALKRAVAIGLATEASCVAGSRKRKLASALVVDLSVAVVI